MVSFVRSAHALSLAAALGCGLVASTAVAQSDEAAPAFITILQVNDWDRYGEDDGRGGYAKLVTILRDADVEAENVIFLHAGDAISPSLLSGFDQGAHMIELLNELPLEAFTMGNHEFDFGPDVAAERVAEATFPVVNSNVKTAGGELFPGTVESLMLEIEGVMFGFYGLTTPDTIEIASPGDTVFEPVLETGLAMQEKLRAEGAEIVVALVHTGFDEDMTLYRGRAADLVLTGHDHDLRVMYDGRTAMVESGSQANYVTAIQLAVSRNEDGEVSWQPQFRVLDSADYIADETALARLQPFEEKLSAELDIEIGEALVELDTQRATVRSQESNFGNLIADAMRSATGADVGLTNGGGIRGDRLYEAGHVLTRRDILTELPFGNTTVLVELSGADLLAALENGVSQVEDGAGRFPQVSGLTFTFDASKPAGERVSDVMVGGSPLDPAATYTVATNDYMLGGGDGYASLGNGEVIIDAAAATLMASTVVNYITALGGKVQVVAGGRITRLD
jgi:2',3'-cyclic-nucleotide 2'-phosphodiesterase (5'-nucleotidase family)